MDCNCQYLKTKLFTEMYGLNPYILYTKELNLFLHLKKNFKNVIHFFSSDVKAYHTPTDEL